MIFLKNYGLAVFLFAIIVFSGCKKEETFDKKPDFTFNGNIIFSPEATGTSATNQNNLFFLPNANEFSSVTAGADSAFGYMTVDTDKGVYFNANSNSKQSVFYKISIATPLFKHSALKPGTYSSKAGTYTYPVTNPFDANVKSPGGAMTATATAFNYSGTWVSKKSNGSTAFDYSSIPDSYMTITYTNVYNRKLEDGVHTYIDGSVDVTMIGYQYPQPSNGLKYFEDQAELKATFSGLEIKNY